MKQFPAEPKPFDFVLFRDAPQRAKPPGHQRWHDDAYTGALDCSLTLLSPLHVGSGLFCLINGEVVKEAFRRDTQLVIPGSSLKGAFRSAAEAISRSCASKTSLRPNQLARGDLGECDDLEHLCVCCRLFGGLGYLGRVRFTDALLAQYRRAEIRKIPALWAPDRDRRAHVYRNDKWKYKGRKFYYHGRLATGKEPLEAVPQGAGFDFRVDLESLSAAELCLLLTAMGVFGSLRPKIGGAKPVCLGSVQVKLKQARLWQPRQVAQSYSRCVMTLDTSQLQQRVGSARQLIVEDALRELESIWRHPNNRSCPSGLY